MTLESILRIVVILKVISRIIFKSLLVFKIAAGSRNSQSRDADFVHVDSNAALPSSCAKVSTQHAW